MASPTSRSSSSACSSPASSAQSENPTRSVKTIARSCSPRPRPCASAIACHTCSAVRPASRSTPGRSAVTSARRLPTSCGCSRPAVESGSPNLLSPGSSSRRNLAAVSSFGFAFVRLAWAASAAPNRRANPPSFPSPDADSRTGATRTTIRCRSQVRYRRKEERVAAVETVQGAVDGGDPGGTLIHEHVRFRDESIADQWPRAYAAEEEHAAAVDSVKAAAGNGVQTICDPTVMFGGRDVRFMQRVAEETSVRIVASTGIYTYDYLPHYFANRDADAMADLFVSDIEEGIQGTDIKAAFLKCAADEPGLTDGVEKVHRAVARASNRTGAPIMAHSRPASVTGPKQIDIFGEEGALTDEHFQTMFVDNARRWLTGS